MLSVGTLLLKARVSEPGVLRRFTARAVWGMGLGAGLGRLETDNNAGR